MSGVPETIFAPEKSVTRGMAAVILQRLEGEPEAAAAGSTDVAAGSWYANAVNWAAANGIMQGYSAEKFGPADCPR